MQQDDRHRLFHHRQTYHHQHYPTAGEGVPVVVTVKPVAAGESAIVTAAVATESDFRATDYGDAEGRHPHEACPLVRPAALPIFALPDEVLALVCCFLGTRELGRVACVARRFTKPWLTEPVSDEDAHEKLATVRLSLTEEGARLRMVASAAGYVPTQNGEATWMRALWRTEHPMAFASCGPAVALSDGGA